MQVGIATPSAAFCDLITNKDKPLVEAVKAVKNKFSRQSILDYKEDLANMNGVDSSDMLASLSKRLGFANIERKSLVHLHSSHEKMA
jgi:Holliday junction resolvasome RuvABC DNA-binding subunit